MPAFLRRFVVLAIAQSVGCSTATGDDVETTRQQADAAAHDAAVTDTSNIFAVEDTAPPGDVASHDTGLVTDAADAAAETAPSTLTLTVDTLECRIIVCPLTHPYVVGCNLTIGGLSSIGCAANVTTNRTLSIKEGQECGSIDVRGTVTCSTVAGTGLNKTNCVMNKATPMYVATLSACPT